MPAGRAGRLGRRHDRGRAGRAAAVAAGGETHGSPAGAHYRNYWWVREPGPPFYHATGIYGQDVLVHVSAQLVVVKLSTRPTALSPARHEATVAAGHAIAAALGG